MEKRLLAKVNYSLYSQSKLHTLKFTKTLKVFLFGFVFFFLLVMPAILNAQIITEGFETSNWTSGTTTGLGEIPATLNQFPGNPTGSWTVNSFVVLTTSTTGATISNANTGTHGVYVNASSSSLIITPIFTGGIATVTFTVWPTSATAGLFVAVATTTTTSGLPATTAIPAALTSSISSNSSSTKGIWSGSVFSVGGVAGTNVLTSGVWNTITFTANVLASQSAMLKFQRDNAGGVVIDNITITPPVPPSVALASASPAVAAANLPQGTNGNEIYDFNLTATGSTATLSSVSFTTTGSYVATDVTNFHLLYNSTADNFGAAVVQPPALVNTTGPGNYTITLTTPLSLPVGGPYYFYISADIAANPTSTVGHTVVVSAITTGNLGFSGTTLSGSASAGGLQTISAYVAPVAYYNKANTDVSQLSNWGTNTNGTGTAPTAFSTPNATYYLFNGTTNTLVSNTSISGTTDSLFIGDSTGIINPSAATLTMGAQLTIGTSAAAEVTTKGILTVNGYLLNSGSFLNRGTMTVTGVGSTYEHAVNGSSIPTATWGANSTCLVSGSTAAGPGNGNQSFYNLTWDCTGQTGNYNLGFANNTIAGNLTVTSTGSGRLNLTSSTVTPNTITISGNLAINGAASFTSCGSSTPTGSTITMNVTGNISTVTGSTLDLENGAGATSTWNLDGNLTIGGTLKEGNNTNTLHFAKGSGTQSFTNNAATLSTIASPGGLYVDNGSTLDLGANKISGGISFTLSSGGTLETTLATGVNGNLTTTGTIALNAAADYIFDGTTAQVTGASVTTANNIKVSNTAGVTLSGNTTVAGLTLTSGALVIGANTLTVSGAVTGTGTITGSATSNLTLNGSTGTLNFTAAGQLLNNLALGSAATATLGTALAIASTGSLNVTSGGVLTAGNNLTLNSDASGTASVGPNTSGGTYISGNVTVQRYIPANSERAWRLLSIPTKTTQTINQSWQEGFSGGTVGITGFGTQITTSSAARLSDGFDYQQREGSMFNFNQSSGLLGEITTTNGNTPSDTVANPTGGKIATTSGYFIYIRGDRTESPASVPDPTSSTILRTIGPLYEGSQAYPSISSGSFGLLGNLYASAIDFTKLTLGGGLDDQFYLWDPKILDESPSLGAYVTFSPVVTPAWSPMPGGGSYTTGVANTLIQSGQAFFVHATGSTGTVTLPETGKASGSAMVFRPEAPTTASGQLTTYLYEVTDTTSSMADGAAAVFNSVYSNAVDGYDALKFESGHENLGILQDGKLLVIEAGQPATASDTLYFNMSNMLQMNYKLEFTPLNMDKSLTAYLVDNYLGTQTPISLNSVTDIAFTVNSTAASFASNRFSVIFNSSTPTPVNFISVGCKEENNNSVAVSWEVGVESGISKYEVEHSTDGKTFTTVGEVAAKGDNNGTTIYNFTDAAAALNGENYYRIEAIGTSGAIEYSNIVLVSTGSAAPGISVYPNPVTENIITVGLNNLSAGNYNVSLLNASGQKVYSTILAHGGGNSKQTVNIPGAIATGVYQLEITAPNNNHNNKYNTEVIINKAD